MANPDWNRLDVPSVEVPRILGVKENSPKIASISLLETGMDGPCKEPGGQLAEPSRRYKKREWKSLSGS